MNIEWISNFYSLVSLPILKFFFLAARNVEFGDWIENLTLMVWILLHSVLCNIVDTYLLGDYRWGRMFSFHLFICKRIFLYLIKCKAPVSTFLQSPVTAETLCNKYVKKCYFSWFFCFEFRGLFSSRVCLFSLIHSESRQSAMVD